MHACASSRRIAVIAVAIACLPASLTAQDNGARAISEQFLVTLDASTRPQSLVISPDGSRVAFVRKKGDQEVVVVDGEEGRPYNHVTYPVFSGDSRHVAYAATTNSSWNSCDSQSMPECRWFVVLDGKEGAPYSMVSNPRLSHDGQHVAYQTADGNLAAVVHDGQSRLLHYGISKDDSTGAPALALSPDGRRVAYVATEPGRRPSTVQARAVVDGIRGEVYDEIRTPVFSPDGRRVAYAARVGQQWLLVVDGKASIFYDTLSRPVFSPDSQHIAFPARSRRTTILQDSWRMNLDGKVSKYYESVNSPVYSPDGSRLIFAAESGGDWTLIENDRKISDKHDYVIEALFSPDGRRIAFVAKTYLPGGGERYVVVTDSVPGKSYGNIQGLAFSPDSRHLAYVAQEGSRWFVVVDGQERHAYDGRLQVVLDGEPEAIVYFGQTGDQWRELVKPLPRVFDDGFPNLAPLTFDADGRLRYLRAKDGGSIYRVEERIE